MTKYTWNHRVVNCPSENGGDDYFTFKEVHYEEGVPVGYSDSFLCSSSKKGLKLLTKQLKKARKLPALHEDDFKKSWEEYPMPSHLEEINMLDELWYGPRPKDFRMPKIYKLMLKTKLGDSNG